MNESIVRQLRVLMLGDPDELEAWSRKLEEDAAVEHVGTPDEVLSALARQAFDLVVCAGRDFPAFQDAAIAGQVGYVSMGADQGVCVVGRDGRVSWSNAYLDGLSETLRARVLECCRDAFPPDDAADVADTEDAPAHVLRARRHELAGDEGAFYELAVTPVIERDGSTVAMAGVVRDATHSRRLKSRLDAIDRAGRELLRLDSDQISRLDMQERLALLEQKTIRYTRDLLHFDNFTVFVLDKNTNKLELVLASGMPSEVKAIDLYAYKEGNGICGYVAATGRSYVCPDATRDTRYIPGLSNARSSLTVPLHVNDQLVGVFNVESVRVNGFSEEDRQFARLFGGNIAMALHILELLITERHTTTGRLGKDIMSEVTGPLNDVLTELETLVEDYLGLDDLRHRLRKLSEHVVGVRNVLKQATSPRYGLLTFRPSRAARVDPILKDKRILIVDDEDMIRETVRDVLAGYGCDVRTASDGDQAIGQIRAHPFDLVLSDIKLPIKNGYEVFAASKAANPRTPVMLMTGFGYDPNHAIVRANREGLTAVLFKPFKVDQLLGEIRTALRSAQV